MTLDPNGNLIEDFTATGRPYVAVEKQINGRRTVLIDKEGNTYSLDAKVKQSFSGTVTETFSFDDPMRGICLSNDGSSDITLVVNGMSFVVMVGEVFQERFDEFSSIDVQGSSPYRGYVTD